MYDHYWYYATHKELVNRGSKVPPIGLLFSPILGLAAIAVLQCIANHLFAGGTGTNGSSKIVSILSVLIGLVCATVFVPLYVYWFTKYCKAVE
jgi:hypothetical protein